MSHLHSKTHFRSTRELHLLDNQSKRIDVTDEKVVQMFKDIKKVKARASLGNLKDVAPTEI
jgi:hypothetical protein